MQRNKRKFNKTPGRPQRFPQGNVLTLEQRRLVERQQEMLRNMSSTNQGISPFSSQAQPPASPFNLNQVQPLFPTIGNVLPPVSLLSGFLAARNLLPPASLVPSPVGISSSARGNSSSGTRPSLLGPGPPGNSLYGSGSKGAANDYRRQASGGNFVEDRGYRAGQGSNFKRDPSSVGDRLGGPQDRRTAEQSWNNRERGAERSWELERGKRTSESEERSLSGNNSWGGKFQARGSLATSNLSGQNRERTDYDTYSSSEGFERNQNIGNKGQTVSGDAPSGKGRWRNDDAPQAKGQWGNNDAPRAKEQWSNNEGVFDRRGNWDGGQKSDDEIDEEGQDDGFNYDRDFHDDNPSKRHCRDWDSAQKEGDGSRPDKMYNDESRGWGHDESRRADKGPHVGGRNVSDKPGFYEARWAEGNQNSNAVDKPSNKGFGDISSPNNTGYAERVGSCYEREMREMARSRSEKINPENERTLSRNNSFDGTDKLGRQTDGSRPVPNKGRNNQNLSNKNVWQARKNQSDIPPLMSPSNFLYPDSGKRSDIWSRLDSVENVSDARIGLREERGAVEDILLTPENAFGWEEGFKSLPLSAGLNDLNLQLQTAYLEEQRQRLDSCIFTGNPNQTALSQGGIWENQSGPDRLKQEGGGDLRALLRSKAKPAPKPEPCESDLGGWSENMVVIYPFVKTTRLTQRELLELREAISQQIHLLLSEDEVDVQPRFFGTGFVCKNWFMIDCADSKSADWLLTWKPRLKTKAGMNLCIRRGVDAARVTHISIFLRGTKETIRDIELRLTHQNPHLEPRMWRRGSHSTSSTGVTVTFYVDDACMRLLEANSWLVYYELAKFKVSVKERKPIIPLVYTKNK